jgi:hypothetical protein
MVFDARPVPAALVMRVTKATGGNAMLIVQGLNAVQLVLAFAVQSEITLATLESEDIVATARNSWAFIPARWFRTQNLKVPSVAVVIESPR